MWRMPSNDYRHFEVKILSNDFSVFLAISERKQRRKQQKINLFSKTLISRLRACPEKGIDDDFIFLPSSKNLSRIVVVYLTFSVFEKKPKKKWKRSFIYYFLLHRLTFANYFAAFHPLRLLERMLMKANPKISWLTIIKSVIKWLRRSKKCWKVFFMGKLLLSIEVWEMLRKYLNIIKR